MSKKMKHAELKAMKHFIKELKDFEGKKAPQDMLESFNYLKEELPVYKAAISHTILELKSILLKKPDHMNYQKELEYYEEKHDKVESMIKDLNKLKFKGAK